MSTIRAGTTTTTALTQTGDTTGNIVLTADSGVINASSTTGGLVVPTGTTAQRPGTPTTGTQRWNTTLGSLELYDGSAWGAVGGGGAGAWQAVQTSSFAAVSGNAYFVNTTSGAITVTLPASPSAGAYVQLVDYARTWATNNVTLNPNGLKISGSTSNVALTQSGNAVALVYSDSTQGWVCYSQGSTVGSYTATILTVGGGGGGGAIVATTPAGGGGGAGGVLYDTGVTLVPGTAYSIIVGAGGVTSGSTQGNGSNSTSPANTATGGGGGASWGGSYNNGGNGGSGGGGSYATAGGSGTIGQGNSGGAGNTTGQTAGGGGGASSGGANATSGNSGAGGAGTAYTITGSSVYFGGGGGGGTGWNGQSLGGGGVGGGGNGGAYGGLGVAGTANTGGGAGGIGGYNAIYTGGGATGGSGIVVISYVGSQRATGGTVTSASGSTIHTFTSSGTFTA